MKTATPLYYRETGSGDPVVLLHGYLSSGKYWKSLETKLARHHRVINIDLLGFGRSPKPKAARYDLDDQIAAIKETLDALDISRAIMVGHSMGAIIALDYSLRYPRRVSQLILANMPVFADAEQARQDFRNTSLIYQILLYSPVRRLPWPFLKVILPFVAEHGPKSDRMLYLSHMAGHGAKAREGSLKHVVEQTDVLSRLKQVKVPTTLLMGEHDRPVYKRNLVVKNRHLTIKWQPTAHHIPVRMPEEIERLVDGEQ